MADAGLSDSEVQTTRVYGDTFALYDEKAFDDFLRPLEERLAINGIATEVFSGARCLDAGCGGGRASVLMARHGAAHVVSADLSLRNLLSTRNMAVRKELGCRVSPERCSLLALPFPDATFDVVWCNGVLHHTANPDAGLRELARVLKPGGRLWLYLYGSGGIYWHVIRWIRRAIKPIPLDACITLLRLSGAPVGRIAEWTDDWYVPWLRCYTAGDVTRRLHELGFSDADVLKRGVHYDTSERRLRAIPLERELLGEGDLRYFCRKIGARAGNAHPLPDPSHRRGSDYLDPPSVHLVDPPLERIERALSRIPKSEQFAARLFICQSIHRGVRGLLEADGPMDLKTFLANLNEWSDILETRVGIR